MGLVFEGEAQISKICSLPASPDTNGRRNWRWLPQFRNSGAIRFRRPTPPLLTHRSLRLCQLLAAAIVTFSLSLRETARLPLSMGEGEREREWRGGLAFPSPVRGDHRQRRRRRKVAFINSPRSAVFPLSVRLMKILNSSPFHGRIACCREFLSTNSSSIEIRGFGVRDPLINTERPARHAPRHILRG